MVRIRNANISPISLWAGAAPSLLLNSAVIISNLEINSAHESSALPGAQPCPSVFAQEERKLTRNVMRYMLFNQHTKPGVPVKRQDLLNLIMGGYRGSSRMKKLGDLIIKKAQEKFINICGLEMKEVTPQLHSRQGLASLHFQSTLQTQLFQPKQLYK